MRNVSLLIALSLCGCWAELHEPELCLTLTDREVPGTELSEREVALAFDLAPAIPDQPVQDLEVRLVSLSVASDRDLAFLESLSVRAEGAGEIASFVRTGDEAVEAVPTGDVDLGPLLDGEELDLEVVAAGALPAEDWKADVEACFEVSSRIRWFP